MTIYISIGVDANGPISEGLADAIMDRYLMQAEDVLGDEGVERIRAYLPTQYMYLGHNGGTPRFNPVPANAGFQAASIHSERTSPFSVVVSDPTTYGAWIEGIDPLNLVVWPHHRNPPPRRFPGYHTFRIITQELQAEAEVIAERVLPPYLAELQG